MAEKVFYWIGLRTETPQGTSYKVLGPWNTEDGRNDKLTENSNFWNNFPNLVFLPFETIGRKQEEARSVAKALLDRAAERVGNGRGDVESEQKSEIEREPVREQEFMAEPQPVTTPGVRRNNSSGISPDTRVQVPGRELRDNQEIIQRNQQQESDLGQSREFLTEQRPNLAAQQESQLAQQRQSQLSNHQSSEFLSQQQNREPGEGLTGSSSSLVETASEFGQSHREKQQGSLQSAVEDMRIGGGIERTPSLTETASEFREEQGAPSIEDVGESPLDNEEEDQDFRKIQQSRDNPQSQDQQTVITPREV